MFSQLFMDSFSMMICSHLVGRYGRIRKTIPQFKGGLASWQKRRVVELFQEHLDGELKLATLAEECRLSVSHFARSFRRSFGTSAHRYLILRRVEIAKAFLSETNCSLVEIAARTGFSDQAALTRTFANVVGATRENGGVNTHDAVFLSKYRTADPFNRTNRSRPQVHRSGTTVEPFCGCNIAADLTFG